MELDLFGKIGLWGGSVWIGGSLLYAAGYSLYRTFSKNGKKLPPIVNYEAKPIEEVKDPLLEVGINKKRTEEGVRHTLDKLIGDLENREVSQIFYDKIAPSITDYGKSIKKARRRFELFEGGPVRLFEIFKPFSQGGREINPSKTVYKLIDNSQILYGMLKDKVINRMISSLVNNPPASGEGELWRTNFDTYLKDTLNLAGDAAYWLERLSQREDIVGRKVRGKLRSYGINQPEKLPEDVKKLGSNVYDLFYKLDCLPEHTNPTSTPPASSAS
jgi:hypothetical protein